MADAEKPVGPESDNPGNPSRRALIAGVAGLVAGAVASGANRPVEAGHGGGVDPDALHLGDRNFSFSNTTTLVSAASPALVIETFGSSPGVEIQAHLGSRALKIDAPDVRAPVLEIETEGLGPGGALLVKAFGAGGEFRSNDPSASGPLGLAFNTTRIAVSAVAAHPISPSPAVLGVTGRDSSAVQDVLDAADDLEAAGLVGVGVGNYTAIRGIATASYPALEALGGCHISGPVWLSGACKQVTLPKGNKTPSFLDANVTPTCAVLTMARSDPKATVIKWTECGNGIVTFHLNAAHALFDIDIAYVVLDCSEPS